MTERLYYSDSYVREFRARIIETSQDGRRVYLDRTAFYPTSGGQPHDTGTINGAEVIDVVEDGERIGHLTSAPVTADEAACRLDWPRRFDHMQQHSGQHLLSAVLVERSGIPTVSFHLGEESSTIDAGVASGDLREISAIEARVNEIVFENRPIAVAFRGSGEQLDLRKPSAREGALRIVSIEGLDHSACGGTHVRATGEIGPVLIRKLDKMHGNLRIEFLCGLRAVRRARADHDALARISRSLATAFDETPAVVASQTGRIKDLERTCRRLALELAQRRGRELYEATPPDSRGVRRAVNRIPSGSVDDELRALAQSFAAQARAVYLAVILDPPVILLAASPDAGVHAGNVLKAALTTAGGRGGGNAALAQGSAPSREALEAVVRSL